MRQLSATDLPRRSIFPQEMPRYPNLWFLVDGKLPPRRRYKLAIRWLVALLETRLDLRDSFIDDVENPNLRRFLGKPGEGSDFQARIGPLQPYDDPKDPSRSHLHQAHARFYISPLIAAEKEQAAGSFLIPASVHYEVATEDPLHPYVDSCPVCGITGEYDLPIDRDSQDYCLKIHDPLGLELLLHGSIRGKRVADEAGTPIPCLEDLHCRIDEIEPSGAEPSKLACVYFR